MTRYKKGNIPWIKGKHHSEETKQKMSLTMKGRKLSVNVLESIVLIARKYDLDLKHLIETFVEAWSNETSHLGNLKITCREVKKDSATFLITDSEKVVSQFPIILEVLKNPEYLKAQIQYFPSPYHAQRKFDQKQKKILSLP